MQPSIAPGPVAATDDGPERRPSSAALATPAMFEAVLEALPVGVMAASGRELRFVNRCLRAWLGTFGGKPGSPDPAEVLRTVLLTRQPAPCPAWEPWLEGALALGAEPKLFAGRAGRWFEASAFASGWGLSLLVLVDVSAYKRRELLLSELHDRLAGEGENLKAFAQELAQAKAAAAEALRKQDEALRKQEDALRQQEEANRALEREIAERRLLEGELRRLADTDPLTGALNRRHFQELAARELERARRLDLPLCGLMLDLDRFKELNDRHGHEAGDLALKMFADVVREGLRAPAILGRLGGEEFAVLLPSCAIADAVRVAERLRKRVEKARIRLPSGEDLGVTVSIGVAERQPDEAAFEACLARADKALYAAKAQGRNRACRAKG